MIAIADAETNSIKPAQQGCNFSNESNNLTNEYVYRSIERLTELNYNF